LITSTTFNIFSRQQGRQHVFVWIASVVAGTANDAIFMALPMVDNFWQVLNFLDFASF
jgi:hypothetical protein